MSNVKRRKMQMTTDLLEMDLLDDSLTLCWVSIYLSIAMPDAAVDYERIDGAHRFSVLGEDAVYEVDFGENALASLEADELPYVLEQIVDRIRADGASGPITSRGEACEELQAA